MERGYSSSEKRVSMPREPPPGGAFHGQTCLVTGGGGIVGHALIGRILREGGTVIAVRASRARAGAARQQGCLCCCATPRPRC
jgi:NADPH:quinone reductase-like Zn-dependent oxidoreductase